MPGLEYTVVSEVDVFLYIHGKYERVTHTYEETTPIFISFKQYEKVV